MLRKRARSSSKNQEKGQITTTLGDDDDSHYSNVVPNLYLSGRNQNQNQNQKPRPNFFNVPGLILGMTPKCVLDCDSIRSPTSPLDFKIFTNLGTSFAFPPTKPTHDLHKCWECSKVGLGIVDSLSYEKEDEVDDDDSCVGKSLKSAASSSNGKKILFGMQIRNKNPTNQVHYRPAQSPNSSSMLLNNKSHNNHNNNNPVFTHRPMKSSHPKINGEVFFQIGEDVLDPYPTEPPVSVVDSGGASFSTTNKRSCCLSVNDESVHHQQQLVLDSEKPIELSEDYTCVITRGPNPKTTHIYGDCILEGHHHTHTSVTSTTRTLDSGAVGMQTTTTTNGTTIPSLPPPSSSPIDNFLSFCHFCNKKLEEGNDIFMYRGEKAFCSFDCRSEEILIEERKEKTSSTTASRVIMAQAPDRSLKEEEHDDSI